MALWDDTRSDWGARSPSSKPTYVAPSERTVFVNHYDGGTPLGLAAKNHSDCLRAVKAFQTYHMDGKGWIDIGYNGLVCPHGRAIEGRGIDYVGAHAGSEANRPGYGIQLMYGVKEPLTPASLTRTRKLYDACVNHSGHALGKKGHRDYMSTTCPGDLIYDWVKTGMPYPTMEEQMSAAEVQEIKDYVRALLVDKYTVSGTDHPGIGKVVEENQRRITAVTEDLADITLTLAELRTAVDAIAPGTGASVTEIADELSKRLQA